MSNFPSAMSSFCAHPSLWPMRRVSAIAHLFVLIPCGVWMGGHFCPSLVFLPAFLFPFPVLCLSGSVLLFPSSKRTLYLSSELLLFTIALGSRPALGERDVSTLHLIPLFTAPVPSSILFRRAWFITQSFLDLLWEQLIKATLCLGCSCLPRLYFWLSFFYF